jgi:hypothetical protein
MGYAERKRSPGPTERAPGDQGGPKKPHNERNTSAPATLSIYPDGGRGKTYFSLRIQPFKSGFNYFTLRIMPVGMTRPSEVCRKPVPVSAVEFALLNTPAGIKAPPT